MSLDSEGTYDALLTALEELIQSEAEIIQSNVYDKIAPLEAKKDRAVSDLIEAGKNLNTSPKDHPLFKDRVANVLLNQQKNIDDISSAMKTNDLKKDELKSTNRRQTSVHSAYKKSLQWDVKSTTTMASNLEA